MCRCNCKSNSCCKCKNSCGCHNIYENNFTQKNDVFPENYLYGYAYIPNQYMNRTFTPETGLENGSIFPELVSPYSPGQSIDFIEYLRNGGM